MSVFRSQVTIRSVNGRGRFMTSYNSTPGVTSILLSASSPEYPHSCDLALHNTPPRWPPYPLKVRAAATTQASLHHCTDDGILQDRQLGMYSAHCDNGDDDKVPTCQPPCRQSTAEEGHRVRHRERAETRQHRRSQHCTQHGGTKREAPLR